MSALGKSRQRPGRETLRPLQCPPRSALNIFSRTSPAVATPKGPAHGERKGCQGRGQGVESLSAACGIEVGELDPAQKWDVYPHLNDFQSKCPQSETHQPLEPLLSTCARSCNCYTFPGADNFNGGSDARLLSFQKPSRRGSRRTTRLSCADSSSRAAVRLGIPCESRGSGRP